MAGPAAVGAARRRGAYTSVNAGAAGEAHRRDRDTPGRIRPGRPSPLPRHRRYKIH